jgi:hypothetical protein
VSTTSVRRFGRGGQEGPGPLALGGVLGSELVVAGMADHPPQAAVATSSLNFSDGVIQPRVLAPSRHAPRTRFAPAALPPAEPGGYGDDARADDAAWAHGRARCQCRGGHVSEPSAVSGREASTEGSGACQAGETSCLTGGTYGGRGAATLMNARACYVRADTHLGARSTCSPAATFVSETLRGSGIDSLVTSIISVFLLLPSALMVAMAGFGFRCRLRQEEVGYADGHRRVGHWRGADDRLPLRSHRQVLTLPTGEGHATEEASSFVRAGS